MGCPLKISVDKTTKEGASRRSSNKEEACRGGATSGESPPYGDWISVQRNRRRQTKTAKGNSESPQEDSVRGSYGKDQGGSAGVNSVANKGGGVGDKGKQPVTARGGLAEAIDVQGQRARSTGSRFSHLEVTENLEDLDMETDGNEAGDYADDAG